MILESHATSAAAHVQTSVFHGNQTFVTCAANSEQSISIHQRSTFKKNLTTLLVKILLFRNLIILSLFFMLCTKKEIQEEPENYPNTSLSVPKVFYLVYYSLLHWQIAWLRQSLP